MHFKYHYIYIYIYKSVPKIWKWTPGQNDNSKTMHGGTQSPESDFEKFQPIKGQLFLSFVSFSNFRHTKLFIHFRYTLSLKVFSFRKCNSVKLLTHRCINVKMRCYVIHWTGNMPRKIFVHLLLCGFVMVVSILKPYIPSLSIKILIVYVQKKYV